MQYFPVAETGIAATPICQYMNPDCLLLAGVSGFDDRERLNQILLHRYVIQYEPFYYKGHLRNFPLTLAYGQQIDALRRKYKVYLWDGKFRDTRLARISAPMGRTAIPSSSPQTANEPLWSSIRNSARRLPPK